MPANPSMRIRSSALLAELEAARRDKECKADMARRMGWESLERHEAEIVLIDKAIEAERRYSANDGDQL